MKINVLAFGIAKEIFGESSFEVESGQDRLTVSDLKLLVETKQPKLKDIGAYMIAVNNEYGEDDCLVKETDEVAIIPPVSGG